MIQIVGENGEVEVLEHSILALKGDMTMVEISKRCETLIRKYWPRKIIDEIREDENKAIKFVMNANKKVLRPLVRKGKEKEIIYVSHTEAGQTRLITSKEEKLYYKRVDSNIYHLFECCPHIPKVDIEMDMETAKRLAIFWGVSKSKPQGKLCNWCKSKAKKIKSPKRRPRKSRPS